MPTAARHRAATHSPGSTCTKKTDQAKTAEEDRATSQSIKSMGRPAKSKKKTCTVETQTDESWVISKEAFCNELMKEEILIQFHRKWEEKFHQLQSQVSESNNVEKLLDKVNQLADKQSEIQRKFKLSEEDRYTDKEIIHGADYQVETVIPEKISEVQDSLASKFDDFEENIESLTNELRQTKDHLNTKIDKTTSVADEQRLSLDAVEQQLKSRNVVVHGMPESENETLKEKLVDLAVNVLGVNMKCSDIENAFRFGRSTEDNPRKLLVKFRSKQIRDMFYLNRKKTPINPSGCGNIYINEDLTQRRSKLFHDTRVLVRRGRLHSTWTQYGNVMIKTKHDAKPVPVFSNRDLRMTYEDDNSNISSDIDTTNEDEL